MYKQLPTCPKDIIKDRTSYTFIFESSKPSMFFIKSTTCSNFLQKNIYSWRPNNKQKRISLCLVSVEQYLIVVCSDDDSGMIIIRRRWKQICV